MSTKTKLVMDLMSRLLGTDTPFGPRIQEIIDKARDGCYHDFESELATPKMQLVKDLQEAGFDDLVEKVKLGDYDE